MCTPLRCSTGMKRLFWGCIHSCIVLMQRQGTHYRRQRSMSTFLCLFKLFPIRQRGKGTFAYLLTANLIYIREARVLLLIPPHYKFNIRQRGKGTFAYLLTTNSISFNCGCKLQWTSPNYLPYFFLLSPRCPHHPSQKCYLPLGPFELPAETLKQPSSRLKIPQDLAGTLTGPPRISAQAHDKRLVNLHILF